MTVELLAKQVELRKQLGNIENEINTKEIKQIIINNDQYVHGSSVCNYTEKFNEIYYENDGKIVFCSKSFEVELVDNRYYIIRKIF